MQWSPTFVLKMRFTARRIFDDAKGARRLCLRYPLYFRETHLSPIVAKTGASRFFRTSQKF